MPIGDQVQAAQDLAELKSALVIALNALEIRILMLDAKLEAGISEATLSRTFQRRGSLATAAPITALADRITNSTSEATLSRTFQRRASLATAAPITELSNRLTATGQRLTSTIKYIGHRSEIEVVLQNLQTLAKMAGLAYTEAHKEISAVIAARRESAAMAWKVSTFALKTGISFITGAASVALADVIDFGTRQLMQTLFANGNPVPGAAAVRDWHSDDIGGTGSLSGKASQGAMDGSRDTAKDAVSNNPFREALEQAGVPDTFFMGGGAVDLASDEPLTWFQQSEVAFGQLAGAVRRLEVASAAALENGTFDRAAVLAQIKARVETTLAARGYPCDWAILSQELDEPALMKRLKLLFRQTLWRHFARSRWTENNTYAYKVWLKEGSELAAVPAKYRSQGKLLGKVADWPGESWKTSGWNWSTALYYNPLSVVATLGGSILAAKEAEEPIGWSHILGSFKTVEELELLEKRKNGAVLRPEQTAVLERQAWVSRAVISCCQVSARHHSFTRETWYDLEFWDHGNRGNRAPYAFVPGTPPVPGAAPPVPGDPKDYKYPPWSTERSQGEGETKDFELVTDARRMVACEISGGRSGRGTARWWTPS